MGPALTDISKKIMMMVDRYI